MENNEPNEPLVFYASKTKLVHFGINIALAPALLYVIGVWPWPPGLVHLAVFSVTGLLGLRYARTRWGAPRLIIDAAGLHCGKTFLAEDIVKVEAVM
ncbi:MAG: hypothetical protein GKR96_13415 [Gammaproteobacteria bacterium]|nr:hypothetical protein [Gammaproteobacteria bacterium]